ncbi:DNA repair protein RecN [Cardinium endosymbiont of Culicoides punctatus]|uniref:DNA repair protein RecN n=1 Tax=Cardinium endosymbiont of Culicoides punctatus TaxID=2304601 RepID=UPI001058FE9B|nr:DNA repair protein RecN [Cardinium endosymbiont of Culicoides punctatus]TDG95458.1 DNA repair protein RecN [Cardinium endosymbiont of Culicoides punctatus]
MIYHLSIRNFVLIEQLDIDFSKGLCVITGETGAGKSIILDAILFCLGGKYTNDVIRAGADQCDVTLCFYIKDQIKNYISALEIEPAEGNEELIIKRIKTRTGRNKFLVNHQPVTHKVIEMLFHALIELHGQHTHTALLNPATYIEILDEYGDLINLKNEVANLYKNYQKKENEIKKFDQEREKIEREIDYFQFLCKELDNAHIIPNEEDQLIEKKEILKNREQDIQLIHSISSDLKSTNIGQVMERSQRSIRKHQHNDRFHAIHTHLEEAYDHIESVQMLLKTLLNGFERTDTTLEQVEERLHELKALSRKHNCSTMDLPQQLSKCHQQLNELESKITNNNTLQQEVIEAKKNYLHKAEVLSTMRKKYATKLAEQTMATLSLLQMPKAIFTIKVDRSACSEVGIDQIAFMASTNPGMPLASLDKIASGGELSRFMLGLRTALLDKVAQKVVVFDEIDVGSSGSVSDAIGEHLRNLSNVAQVIAITHQPQVAGKADQHILIEKKQYEAQTVVNVKTLFGNDRLVELARMISGKHITEAGIKAAKELIHETFS